MSTLVTFEISKGGVALGTKTFARDIIKIGRLASAHLSVDDDKLSRIHCVVQVDSDGQVSLLDMGSAAGTFVNGKRQSKAELRSGDEVVLGDTHLVVQLRAAIAPAPPLEPVEPEALLDAGPGSLQASTGPLPRTLPQVPLRLRGRASAAHAAPYGVEVRVFWGETLLFSTLRVRPLQITLGARSTVDFSVPEAFLPKGLRTPGQLAIVQTSARGAVAFRFAPDMVGAFQAVGQPPAALSDLVTRGFAANDDGAYSLPLAPGAMAWTTLGPLTVEVAMTPAPARPAAPFWDGLDHRFVNLALLMGFGMLAFLIGAATCPFDTDTDADGIVRNPQAIAHFRVGPPKPVDRFVLRTDTLEKPVQAAAAPSKPATAGAHTPRLAGRRASKLTSQEIVLHSGIFEALGSVGQLAGGIGGGSNALGHLTGTQIGDAAGMGGLSLRGPAEPGGGFDGNLGIGPIGTQGLSALASEAGNRTAKKQSAAPEITTPLPVLVGCMDKELVRRVIHDHHNQVKACYEAELQRHPGLSGKVTVEFVIGTTGAVDHAGIDSSSLGDAAVERCIQNRVSTWLFPKPTCGGVAQVRYPFLLKEAGD